MLCGIEFCGVNRRLVQLDRVGREAADRLRREDGEDAVDAVEFEKLLRTGLFQQ